MACAIRGKIQDLATYTHIITFSTGTSMEELRIQGFHVYQDNWKAAACKNA